jgi:hypothetical protein
MAQDHRQAKAEQLVHEQLVLEIRDFHSPVMVAGQTRHRLLPMEFVSFACAYGKSFSARGLKSCHKTVMGRT